MRPLTNPNPTAYLITGLILLRVTFLKFFFVSFLKLLDILLGEKANCLLQDGNGKTPLHIAAETGNARHVKALAKASFASIRQKDANGRTPLHFAALNGERLGFGITN